MKLAFALIVSLLLAGVSSAATHPGKPVIATNPQPSQDNKSKDCIKQERRIILLRLPDGTYKMLGTVTLFTPC